MTRIPDSPELIPVRPWEMLGPDGVLYDVEPLLRNLTARALRYATDPPSLTVGTWELMRRFLAGLEMSDALAALLVPAVTPKGVEQ